MKLPKHRTQNISYTGLDGSGDRDYNFNSNDAISYSLGLYYDDNPNNFTGGGKVDFGYDTDRDFSGTNTNLTIGLKYNFSQKAVSISNHTFGKKMDHSIWVSTKQIQ